MVQRPDEAKRREIVDVASRLFASRPFHAVKLADIAAEAGIGKGTLYIYFASKEALYSSLILEALSQLVAEVSADVADERTSSRKPIAVIVRRLVGFGFRFPHLIELLRHGAAFDDERLLEKRRELSRLIESVIRRGIRDGEMADSHPELSAQYILAFVRVAMLHKPTQSSEKTLATHMLHVIENGLASKGRDR